MGLEEFICLQCGMETKEPRCPRCKLRSGVRKEKLEQVYGPDWEKRIIKNGQKDK